MKTKFSNTNKVFKHNALNDFYTLLKYVAKKIVAKNSYMQKPGKEGKRGYWPGFYTEPIFNDNLFATEFNFVHVCMKWI